MKTLLLVLFLIVFRISSQAQGYNAERASLGKAFSKERFYLGGGLGLQFGDITLIDVSPLVGYQLTKRLSVGLSPTYKYYKQNHYFQQTQGYSNKLTANIFGGSIFARLDVISGLFAHVESESLHYVYKPRINAPVDIWSLFVGGGYQQMIGGKAAAYVLVLWNLNDGPYSPYINPIFRLGFGFGL